MPGSPKKRCAPARPERQRLAGLLRHLPEPALHPERIERFLDEVELAHRHAPRREDDVGLRGLGQPIADVLEAIARDRQHDRLAARFGDGGGQRVGVAVDDLAGAGRLVHLDQLRAGRQDRHARAAVHARWWRGRRTRARPDRPRRAPHPPARPSRRSRCPRPRCRTLVPGFTATWMTTVPSRSSVSSTRTTVSAPAGITEPVKIFAAVPGSTGTSSSVPAGALPITRSRTGAVADVGAADGEAVHGGVRRRRHGTRRDDVLGGDAPEGRRQERPLSAEYRRRVQDRTAAPRRRRSRRSDSARLGATQRDAGLARRPRARRGGMARPRDCTLHAAGAPPPSPRLGHSRAAAAALAARRGADGAQLRRGGARPRARP